MAATGETGCWVTVKSLLPVMATWSGLPVRFRSSEPTFLIVNVRVTEPPIMYTLPKSVWSLGLGIVSPSKIT
ncbi:hypothetical protein ES703_91687 [subsurface metagenome]